MFDLELSLFKYVFFITRSFVPSRSVPCTSVKSLKPKSIHSITRIPRWHADIIPSMAGFVFNVGN